MAHKWQQMILLWELEGNIKIIIINIEETLINLPLKEIEILWECWVMK